MERKILFIRTYLPSGMGGPLPPVDLLSAASYLLKNGADARSVKIIDTGLLPDPLIDTIADIVSSFKPELVCCGSLPWEAGLVHEIAAVVRKSAPVTLFAVQGQLAALLAEDLLRDGNIDCAVIGDPEETLKELLGANGAGADLTRVKGIICRRDGVAMRTGDREPLSRLDDTAISPEAWSLIDFRAYSREQGWNGALAERWYLPVLTSRGCPFGCRYCGIPATAGKTFRPRAVESVIGEIAALHRAFGVTEFHVFDAAFNADPSRAAEICRKIIAARLPVRLAFPHGLRADCMTDELVGLLRDAGTYKVVYGIETASPRLQAAIGKKLDLSRTRQVIEATARSGIITGGYFMLGFPDESIDEMRRTVSYAVSSELDTAAFFKVLDYEDLRRLYRAWWEDRSRQGGERDPFSSFTYFSRDHRAGTLSAAALNGLLFEAQRSFYLNRRRLGRLWKKSPRKGVFLKNLVYAGVRLLASFLLVAASRPAPEGAGH